MAFAVLAEGVPGTVPFHEPTKMIGLMCSRVLRALPPELAQSLYYRFVRGWAPGWHSLYSGAPLRFARGCRMHLVPGDEVSGAIALTGVYELELTRFLVEKALHGGLLVDIGANLGYHSLLWAAQGSASHSLAVEASPVVFECLQRNIAANPGASVQSLALAASDRSGTVRFAPSGSAQMGWGHISESGPCEVPSARIDEILGLKTRVRVLKIDAEGHDLTVLSGATEIIRSRLVDWLVFESNPAELAGPNGQMIAEMLEVSGYSRPRPLGKPTQGTGIFVSSLKEIGQN